MADDDRDGDAGTCTSSSTSCTLDETTGDVLRRARRGGRSAASTVRVLLDHWAIAATPRLQGDAASASTAMGAKWQLMLPVQPFKGKYQRPDLRNHRKLLVVDGRVAFMGSQNMIDRTLQHRRRTSSAACNWKELMVAARGPGRGRRQRDLPHGLVQRDRRAARRARPTPLDVDRHRRRSTARWCRAGPGFDGENNLRLFLALLYARAASRIIITSPYFVPDEAMLYAITTAVPARRRGRAVRLGDRRPGDGLPRPALATTRRCCEPGCASACTRRRTSCTRSTSRSTTRSR